ncbi:MAG: hypothetical protein ACHREM_31430, partial [Polyangiales bacterium]
MNDLRFSWCALGVVAASCASACNGSGGDGSQSSGDTGVPEAASDVGSVDGAINDTPASDVSDAEGLVDGADSAAADVATDGADLPLPLGTRLRGPSNFYGVTTDGYVLFNDGTSVGVVSTSGGAPTMFPVAVPNVQMSWVAAAGQVGLAWWTPSGSALSPLSIWTAAHGLLAVSTSSMVGLAAVSPDGALVAFTDGADLSNTQIVIAHTDGTGKKVLVPTAVPQSCNISFGFAGNGALFVEYCPTALSSGSVTFTMPATVSMFTAPSWTEVPIATGVQPYDSDADQLHHWTVAPAGATLFAALAAAPSQGELIPIPPPNTPAIVAAGAAEGAFDDTGTNVVYRTLAGGLARVSVASPTTPTSIVSSGVGRLAAVAPDGQHALFWKNGTYQ